LVPITFPSFRIANTDVKPVTVHGVQKALPSAPLGAGPGDPADIDFFVAGRRILPDGPTVTAIASIGLDGAKTPYSATLPAGPEAITGGPIWAPILDADPTSSCGEVVIAMNVGAAGQILVFSPCRGDLAGNASHWATERKPISITASGPLVTGLHVTDV